MEFLFHAKNCSRVTLLSLHLSPSPLVSASPPTCLPISALSRLVSPLLSPSPCLRLATRTFSYLVSPLVSPFVSLRVVASLVARLLFPLLSQLLSPLVLADSGLVTACLPTCLPNCRHTSHLSPCKWRSLRLVFLRGHTDARILRTSYCWHVRFVLFMTLTCARLSSQGTQSCDKT